MNQPEEFSIRDFLRQRQALLIHFSTVMGREEFVFPDDLRNAMTLVDTPLSFPTILSRGPYQSDQHPALANAPGSAGIIVDILHNSSVLTVGRSDGGTSYDSRNKLDSPVERSRILPIAINKVSRVRNLEILLPQKPLVDFHLPLVNLLPFGIDIDFTTFCGCFVIHHDYFLLGVTPKIIDCTRN